MSNRQTNLYSNSKNKQYLKFQKQSKKHKNEQMNEYFIHQKKRNNVKRRYFAFTSFVWKDKGNLNSGASPINTISNYTNLLKDSCLSTWWASIISTKMFGFKRAFL